MSEVALREAGFRTLPSTTTPSGVYVLLLDEEMIYIGLSKNVYARVSSHYMTLKRGKPYANFSMSVGDSRMNVMRFNRVLVKWCSYHDALILESELIDKYRPKHNKRVVTPLKDYGIDLDALAEAVGISWKEAQAPRPTKKYTSNWRRIFV